VFKARVNVAQTIHWCKLLTSDLGLTIKNNI
jgi:hypothetical protein